MLDKKAFLSKTARRYIVVEGLKLQSLTEVERSELETRWSFAAEKSDQDWAKTLKRSLIMACAVDADGQLMFATPDDEKAYKEDMDLLGESDGAVIGRLYEACRIHCGFEKGEVEAFSEASDATEG